MDFLELVDALNCDVFEGLNFKFQHNRTAETFRAKAHDSEIELNVGENALFDIRDFILLNLNPASFIGAVKWIFLHETSHFNLGHFDLLGRDEIVETGEEKSFGLISRGESNSSPILELADIDYQLLERCLELQADHEATDIFLNECSHDDIDQLRQRIAAMSAMMVLIDVEDTKRNSKQTSHPKAATRIFQMLGHVCELPLIKAQADAMHEDRAVDPDAIPSEEEQQEFVKQVAIPAFYDAIELAKAADARYIADQLGDLPAFFDDVYLAKTNSDKGVDQFQTEGAKEWFQLKPLNERVLAVQRSRNMI